MIEASTVAQTASFPVRNLRFPIDERVPRHWHGGRRSVTAFLDGLSIFFPAGERFFVRSVLRFEKKISDPKLRADIRGFAGQEGMHNREHLRYNAWLQRLGYPADELDAKVERLLRRVDRRVPARWRLCATAALEHFTALMGHMLLGRPEILEAADPTMAALWRWHAAEENEHKNVAFDVYQAAGGNTPERAMIMVVTALIFWAKVLEHQVRMMQADGIATDVREWVALGKFLFVDPGGMLELVPGFLRWFSPSFHPSDLDADALVDAWKSAQTA